MIINDVLIYFVLPSLFLSMLLIFIRLMKGPSLMDKVIALDLLVIVGIGVISAYAILFNQPVIIDISLILALIAFLSTLGFALFYHRDNPKTPDSDNQNNQ